MLVWQKRWADSSDDFVNEKCNTNMSAQVIWYDDAEGRVRESQLKMGPNGGIPNDLLNILLSAFETCKWIKQINGESGNNRRNLISACVNNAMNNFSNNSIFFDQLLCKSGMELRLQFPTPLKKNLKLTKFNNRSMWFDWFEQVLLGIGSGHKIIGENEAENQLFVMRARHRSVFWMKLYGVLMVAEFLEVMGQQWYLWMEGFLCIVFYHQDYDNQQYWSLEEFCKILPPYFQCSKTAKTTKREKWNLRLQDLWRGCEEIWFFWIKSKGRNWERGDWKTFVSKYY